ncbi:MAG: response regulator transcription factor [Spirochaetaceae bacterium]
MSKIMIIEDDQINAFLLQDELTNDGYEVEIFNNGRSAIANFNNFSFDLILMDIMLPNLNGVEVCRRIRKISQIPIIFLSGKSHVSDIVEGLEAGADDYITKPYEIEELSARIKARLRKWLPDGSSDSIYVVDDLVLNSTSLLVYRAEKQIYLTRKEFLLLEFLMKNHGQIVSKQQILESVWDINNSVDTNSVTVYIGYLRKKINTGFSTYLISNVHGFGYII